MITGHIPELALLLVVALIFFGPKRLPEMGKALGQSIRGFKDGVSHLGDEISQSHEAPHNVVNLPTAAPVTHIDAPEHVASVPVENRAV